MLDTNIVSELARNPHGPIAKRIAEVGPDGICVSIIVAAELRYGCAKKGSPRLLAQIEAILDSIQVLALDIPADTEYAEFAPSSRPRANRSARTTCSSQPMPMPWTRCL